MTGEMSVCVVVLVRLCVSGGALLKMIYISKTVHTPKQIQAQGPQIREAHEDGGNILSALATAAYPKLKHI